jgi:DNA repair protein RadC
MPFTSLRRTTHLPPKDTPSHRLLKYGAEPLGDAELLAVLLKRKELHPLQRLIESFGSLHALLTAAPATLEHHEALGPEPTATLLAAVELGRRLREHPETRPCLSTPEAVYAYLAPRLEGLRREVFHVLCVSNRNVLIRDERVAEGSSDQAAVDPREVFGVAVTTRAPAIILAHSHPSGCPTPSSHDLELTRTLVRAAGFLRIRVLDHVIIGHRSYHSMAGAGELPQQEPGNLMAAS